MRSNRISLGRNLIRGLGLLTTATTTYIRHAWLGAFAPPKPSRLRFLVNDICNSRCVMCNIWERQAKDQISLEQLEKLLQNPIFEAIRTIDLSGGEPTLHPELPGIGHTLCAGIPTAKLVRIETNALETEQVIDRIFALARSLQEQRSDLELNVLVSLDGVDDDHDLNRRVPGNFRSAVQVIRALQNADLAVSVRCTLTPFNCEGAADLLLWCDQNEIDDWVFRLAIESGQFYNNGYNQEYTFSREQRFHLLLFFDRLISQRRLPLTHRQFYKRLMDRLAARELWIDKCRGPDASVTMDMQGRIIRRRRSTIAPMARMRGGPPKSSPLQTPESIYDRDFCYYEPAGMLTPSDILTRGKEAVQGLYSHRKVRLDAGPTLPRVIHPASTNHPSGWRHVLITGWYGTETAGDKAILGELLHFLETHSPACRITITSIDHKVIYQTATELPGLAEAHIVAMDKGHEPSLIEQVDAVIIGGGPLMEIPHLSYIGRIFDEANRQKKARIVFGCGVGPLYTPPMRALTGHILRLATAGFFRDQESQTHAQKLTGMAPMPYACDPAVAYIRRWRKTNGSPPAGQTDALRIVGLLRQNTNEFAADLTGGELGDRNKEAAQRIARVLEKTAQERAASVELLPMNCIWTGGDDRVFNRRVAASFEDTKDMRLERRYLPLDELVQKIHGADAAVVMRYHGHLFALALGIPFLSIDYTGISGKVQSLIRRLGYQEWSEDWHDIEPARAASQLQQLLENREHWSSYLLEQTDHLVRVLDKTYGEVFDVEIIAANGSFSTARRI